MNLPYTLILTEDVMFIDPKNMVSLEYIFYQVNKDDTENKVASMYKQIIPNLESNKRLMKIKDDDIVKQNEKT